MSLSLSLAEAKNKKSESVTHHSTRVFVSLPKIDRHDTKGAPRVHVPCRLPRRAAPVHGRDRLELGQTRTRAFEFRKNNGSMLFWCSCSQVTSQPAISPSPRLSLFYFSLLFSYFFFLRLYYFLFSAFLFISLFFFSLNFFLDFLWF